MELEFATYRDLDPIKLDLNFSTPNVDIFSPLFIPKSTQTTVNKKESSLNTSSDPDIKILKNTYFGETPKEKIIKPANTSSGKSTWSSTYKNNKDGWVNDLTNAYRQAGITNENALKMLVSQDALESAWGKSAQGKFNFGNLTSGKKWEGDIVIGNDKNAAGEPIKQRFRSYENIQDYAKDKVQFLKHLYEFNEADDINTFTNKLKGANKDKRSYAEAKDYKALLTSVYNKFQQGGVLPMDNTRVVKPNITNILEEYKIRKSQNNYVQPQIGQGKNDTYTNFQRG